MREIFSKLNRKLVKDGIISFDLPPVITCVGAGSCKDYCYGKGYKRYPSYREKLALNYELSKTNKLIDELIIWITILQPKFIRIHSLGDFYNQKYLDKWTEVIRMFPEVMFYCYTKSLHLEFPIELNFIKIASYGGKYDYLIDKQKHHSIVIHKGMDIPKGYLIGNESDLTFIKTNNIALLKH